jgi:hypothetical protein
MTLDGAVLNEQGITFALATVPFALLKDPSEAVTLLAGLREHVFPGLPVVLMTREWSGKPHYYGDPDGSRIMHGVHVSRVAWSRYTLA